jgi:hypothetical protein
MHSRCIALKIFFASFSAFDGFIVYSAAWEIFGLQSAVAFVIVAVEASELAVTCTNIGCECA